MGERSTIESFFDIPSVSQFPSLTYASLKLIETSKNLPVSLEDFPSRDRELYLNKDDEYSLAEILNTQTASKPKRGGCNCKKTSCQKMYCECFSSNRACTEECNCCDCKNITTPEEHHNDSHNHHQTIKKNNGSSPSKHCNCKKSMCMKKYCECFNAGIGCGPQCKCIGCTNQPTASDLIPEVFLQKSVVFGSMSFLSAAGEMQNSEVPEQSTHVGDEKTFQKQNNKKERHEEDFIHQTPRSASMNSQSEESIEIAMKNESISSEKKIKSSPKTPKSKPIQRSKRRS